MESEEENDNNFNKLYDQYKDKRDINIDTIKKPKEKIDKRRNKQRSEKQLESLKKLDK